MLKYIKESKPDSIISEDRQSIEDTVRSILSDIRKNGHTAVENYSEKFDKWRPESFKLSKKDIEDSISQLNNS